MNSSFWRYFLILSLLLIIWGEFFVSDGALNQLAFNFALFYPLGFLVGYRPRFEDPRTACLTALIFNVLSYLIALLSGIAIQSWIIVVLDFASLYFYIKLGMIMGKRAQSKE